MENQQPDKHNHTRQHFKSALQSSINYLSQTKSINSFVDTDTEGTVTTQHVHLHSSRHHPTCPVTQFNTSLNLSPCTVLLLTQLAPLHISTPHSTCPLAHFYPSPNMSPCTFLPFTHQVPLHISTLT
jgi:hypothetical protein